MSYSCEKHSGFNPLSLKIGEIGRNYSRDKHVTSIFGDFRPILTRCILSADVSGEHDQVRKNYIFDPLNLALFVFRPLSLWVTILIHYLLKFFTFHPIFAREINFCWQLLTQRWALLMWFQNLEILQIGQKIWWCDKLKGKIAPTLADVSNTWIYH